jgi:hypothetical protein
MMDGSQRVEFQDVHVVAAAMLCRIGSDIVEVSPRYILPGTTVWGQGDKGRLVLTRELAITLGLV